MLLVDQVLAVANGFSKVLVHVCSLLDSFHAYFAKITDYSFVSALITSHWKVLQS